MRYKEIYGDLVILAKHGNFDLIAHGCNCFCQQGAGIAVPMNRNFGTLQMKLEGLRFSGDKEKLGKIDHKQVDYKAKNGGKLTVVNAYTQYYPGRDFKYRAMGEVLYTLNDSFKGKHLGLPLIGCGIAGGDWDIVSQMIQTVLVDLRAVTIVRYEQQKSHPHVRGTSSVRK